VLEVHGTRCPACGFLLAAAPARIYQNSMPPRRRRPAPMTSGTPTAIAVGGAVLAAAIAIGGFWWLRKRDAARAAMPSPASILSTARAPRANEKPAPLEPTPLFAKAKAAALAWHTDAALLSIDIAPVIAGHVEPSGKLTFEFGAPAGKRLGPGETVRNTGFIIRADAAGLRGEEGTIARSTIVAEPNCIFEDVRAQLEKTGSFGDQALRLQYRFSAHDARGVWRVTRAANGEVVRTFDGATCAVLVHR